MHYTVHAPADITGLTVILLKYTCNLASFPGPPSFLSLAVWKSGRGPGVFPRNAKFHVCHPLLAICRYT